MYLADVGRGISDAFKQVDKVNRNIGSGTFTVNRDNVLAAGRIISSQADTLRERFAGIRRDLRIEPPGNDDVSVRMAAAWNDLLINNDDSYRSRIGEYIEGLRKLADRLEDTARAYGISEDEIMAAFGKHQGA